MHNRRRFLKNLTMGGMALGTASVLSRCQSTLNKPNVLFIICDDLNDSLENLGGHPQAKTPHLNRFMQKSTRFVNAHSNDPICGPSRASLLTGIYPHKSGYFGYKQQENEWRKNPVLKDAKTFMEHFGENGYKVYGTGKIFHNGHEDWSVWKDGFGIEPTFGPVAWDGSFKNGTHDHDLGLANPSSFKGNPDGKTKYKWYSSFGSLADVPEYPAEPAKDIPGHKGWVCFGKPFKYNNEDDRDLTPDELNAEWACDLLQKKHNDPFLMCVGMNRPHTPMHAPQKYFDLHPLDSIQLPPHIENDLEDCAKALWNPSTSWTNATGFNKFKFIKDCGGSDNWKRWLQAYLACVSFVDDQIGKILNTLEKSPYAKNTIVIVTSDHGYHMGEKEYVFKNTLWEESSRVPMIIHTPNMQKSQVCDHPVSLLDLYPTMNDLCELEQHPNKETNQQTLDGFSLKPFLKSPENEDWVGPDVALTAVGSNIPRELYQSDNPKEQHYAVRSKRWRYILCNNGEEELYDHKTDPHEWYNVAKKPEFAAIKSTLKAQMKQILDMPSTSQNDKNL